MNREEIRDYDAGLLNDFGGWNVSWWQDYIRSEIGKCNEYWSSQVKTILSEVDRLEARGKALEEDIPDPEWCCTNHKKRLVARIKELEEGIKRHRLYIWGEGKVGYGLDEELYKLLEGKP
uniref:Uncharacterized protein n=1 Tax=viral metagenome TaxID=1070528 RepID=A0A6M3LRI1_9ZZZZ